MANEGRQAVSSATLYMVDSIRESKSGNACFEANWDAI